VAKRDHDAERGAATPERGAPQAAEHHATERWSDEGR